MKRKGFTLVELLAIIILLAGIFMLVYPKLTEIFEKESQKIDEYELDTIYDAVDRYLASNDDYSLVSGTEYCIRIRTLDYEGLIPDFDNKDYLSKSIRVKIGKNSNYHQIIDSCLEDETKPNLLVQKLTQTAKSVTIRVNASDMESGIKTIKYEIDGKTYEDEYNIPTVNAKKTIKDLSAGNTYDLKIEVTNGDGLVEEKTIQVSTNTLQLAIKFNSTPNEAINGYYKKLEAYLDYGSENLTTYYIQSTISTKSNVDALKSCGSGTVPSNCTNITKTKSLSPNTWYYFTSNPRIIYDTTSTITGTLYVYATNGISTITDQTTIAKIDNTDPDLKLGIGIVTSQSISIPITLQENESGIDSITCKYGTSNGNYTQTEGVTVTTGNCTISNINQDTTYYYQVCAKDKMGNETCKTGNNKTTALTVALKATNTPSESIDGYYQKQEWNLDITGTPTGYYIKSTRNTRSTTNLIKSCGDGTVPGDCIDITPTTDMTENIWYYTETKPTIICDTTSQDPAVLYVRITDGTNTTANATATISKIDNTVPTLILGNEYLTSRSISIPLIIYDDQTGLDTVTCKYSTTSGSYTTNASSVSTNNCTISNINQNTTYYYQVCVKDKIGNQNCKTGDAKTDQLTVTLRATNTPTNAINGYYQEQVWDLDITGTPIGVYIKSTRKGISSVGLTISCGSDTNPGTCSSITSTTTMTENTWYYTETKPTITYNEKSTSTGTLYVRITDGMNTASANATISKIG